MAQNYYKAWDLVGDQHIKMIQLNTDEISLRINSSTSPVGVGIDGSSTNTGIAIMNEAGGLIGINGFGRADKEDYVEYKLRLKAELTKLLINCRNNIRYVWYEEPFIGYSNATEVLMAIRTTVKEILIEHKDILGNISFTEVNNKRWKKIFLEAHGSRLPAGGSRAEKVAVADVLKIRLVYDNLTDTRCCASQDEMDATGIVFAGWSAIKEGKTLESKKRVYAFNYEIRFELYDFPVAETEQNVYSELSSTIKEYNIPNKVVENGIQINTLNGRGQFDNLVYSNMGDDDKLLIFIYRSSKYANILIEKCADRKMIEQISSDDKNQSIVAYVWRKNRH